MIKKGEEVKVDESDKQIFEEVQKIVEEQEQKIKEENEGPETVSAVRKQVVMTVTSRTCDPAVCRDVHTCSDA
jgi:hypothetical protein